MTNTVNVQTNSATTNNNTTKLNYNGEPLKANEVLVPAYVDDLFIASNVTNPDSIITINLAGRSFRAVLMAVERKDEPIARAQFNYWQNDILGHYGHRMEEESIDDRAERDLPEYGSSPSAAVYAEEMLLLIDMMNVLINKAPQIAYSALLKMYGVDEMDEYQDKMKLKNNGSYKVLRLTKTIITNMLTNGINNVPVSRTTKKDNYYRAKAKTLLKLVLKLRYQ